VLQLVLMFIVAFLLALDAAPSGASCAASSQTITGQTSIRSGRKVRKMLYAYVRGQLIIAGLIGVLSGIACAVLGLPDPVASA